MDKITILIILMVEISNGLNIMLYFVHKLFNQYDKSSLSFRKQMPTNTGYNFIQTTNDLIPSQCSYLLFRFESCFKSCMLNQFRLLK